MHPVRILALPLFSRAYIRPFAPYHFSIPPTAPALISREALRRPRLESTTKMIPTCRSASALTRAQRTLGSGWTLPR
ncbi:hypothetical protein AcW1_001820 [Taiwanofungus camphoratus]|nr:hypothetical protein AcW1_001820 [Antrodia cinnamomea]